MLALSRENKMEPMIVKEELPLKSEVKIETVAPRSYLNDKPSSSSSGDFEGTVDVIKSKIAWATEQLTMSNVISYNLELLEMIKKASETIMALKQI